ncbi:MAG: PLP-dependent aminotransferase family protein [Oscillospiraceae bacterium]|nr:PLP-dependent aminotransferase family protein [Oscillospiraceae bacterium]
MVRFSSRMNLLKGSAIRELLALANKPEILSFAGGMPAPELVPVEKIKAATNAVLDEAGKVALQYSSTNGFEHFRQQIADRMEAKLNIKTSADNILVTSGSQQGLDYSARVFVNPGDTVIIESPSYLGALNAFKACEPNFVAIPTDGDGMIMEELEKVLATDKTVKMIYVIPDFQNPSGRTWPMERREKFMEIINKYEIPVVEDNPYGELRFEGEYLPALKSMDTKGLVVFLGTFSKILAPGYRLGWVCADGEILAKYNFLAQAASLQASTEAQLVVSKFIDMYDLDEHVAAIKDCYRKRRDVMMATMEREFPEEAKFTHPNGGLFTWVELPEYINTNEMAKECLKRNVAYVPGDGFFPDAGHNNCIRLNYSCMPEEKIEQGMTILGQVIKEYIKK